ncbi:transcriptional regulator [Sporosarcina sp. ACRSL]|uniref:transcriptional regulator n=1 Tax=Sporosarcina sp. ACRSL TaxID=2918215 RepID=UPI001EF5AEA9|nr:transcriptional regulator [Sporosarcina sp. ACRSL]
MRKKLEKSVRYGELLDMMYMAADGSISGRRIRVIQVGEVSFRAYCYLRKSKRTFTIDNVLALVPVSHKERMIV